MRVGRRVSLGPSLRGPVVLMRRGDTGGAPRQKRWNSAAVAAFRLRGRRVGLAPLRGRKS